MKRLHSAWGVCLGCTLMLLVCGGLCVNAFSVAQPYILAQNGFTNTQTSMITTVRAVAYLGFTACLATGLAQRLHAASVRLALCCLPRRGRWASIILAVCLRDLPMALAR